MDYTINGVKVLDGFNIVKEAGGGGSGAGAGIRDGSPEGSPHSRLRGRCVDVFEAGIEIIRGGGEVSPAAPDPGTEYRGRSGQAGSDAPVPDDLPWLRRHCGDGALAYSADHLIFLVELADGETREIGSGRCVEFSPDGTKLAWIDQGVARGRLRKGDPTVHDVVEGARHEAGVHWVGNDAVVVELDTPDRKGYRVSLDGGSIEPVPELDVLDTGMVETDVKLCGDGVWSFVTERRWATSDGRRGDLNGNCSVSLSPDGRSATVLLPGHRMGNLDAIREGGHAGRIGWLYEEGFDNHRWSSNDARFFVCLDEGSTGMVVGQAQGSYATRMGKPGKNGSKMYGDFTVGSGEGGVWIGEP